MARWNLWHGCKKISEGCQNCYVYSMDAMFSYDTTVIRKTSTFDLPVRRRKNGEYVIKPGETVYTCFTSDFFLEEADEWRKMPGK